MTKREWRAAQRMSPLGDAGVDGMRSIVRDHSAMKINEVFVDAFSASAFVQVYDRLSTSNQDRLRQMPVGGAMEIVWQLVDRARA